MCFMRGFHVFTQNWVSHQRQTRADVLRLDMKVVIAIRSGKLVAKTENVSKDLHNIPLVVHAASVSTEHDHGLTFSATR